MGILKEFVCLGHGPFESDKPICPRGCTATEREFRTAPAYHDGNNNRVDRLVRSQVDAMGLGNIKTNLREGETARIESPAMRQQADFQNAIRKKYPSNWGALAPGGTMNVKTGAVDNAGRGAGAVATVTEHHAEATDAVTKLRGSRPTYEAVRDQQGLKMDVSKAA